MKIKINLDLCQGHSVCLAEAPEVFDVIDSDAGYPQVHVLMEQPPESLRNKIALAAKYCPNHVITVEED
jgi:ferredoxin